jgi:hypothetical protein
LAGAEQCVNALAQGRIPAASLIEKGRSFPGIRDLPRLIEEASRWTFRFVHGRGALETALIPRGPCCWRDSKENALVRQPEKPRAEKNWMEARPARVFSGEKNVYFQH